VADFGVARALSEAAADGAPDGRLTGQGLVVGTAEYVSPEQASGDRELDGRTDIYSLGCVLYEMLAGVPPFTGDTPRAVMARRFRESPRSLLELRPEAPAHLAATVERALAADPADRFPTVTSFLAALQSPQANPSNTHRPRVRSLLGWAGALLVAAALMALVLLYGTGHSTLDPRRIVVARLSNETGDSTLAYLGGFATDRLTASLVGSPGVKVVTSATIIPSRLTTGLQVDSLDDPARLHRLAAETSAGTLISGSYFKSNSQVSFQAEITNANDGTVLAAVGPVVAPLDKAEDAVDSLSRSVVAAVRRKVRTHG
jgi:serine/threonine-protein kinase